MTQIETLPVYFLSGVFYGSCPFGYSSVLVDSKSKKEWLRVLKLAGNMTEYILPDACDHVSAGDVDSQDDMLDWVSFGVLSCD